MRVVFYNHTGHVSGAERVLLLALSNLDRENFEPIAICPEGEFAKLVSDLDVPVRTVDELSARFTLRPDRILGYLASLVGIAHKLRKHIRDSQPEVVHANSIRAGLVALYATIGTAIPVFWHVHDELKPHPISTAIRAIVLASRRSRVIAVSHATARSFVGKLLKPREPSRPVAVIHNAVEIDAPNAQSAPKKLRQELGISNEAFLFGLVGQITPRKGQLELVKAFANLTNRMPTAKLLIVGRPIFNNDHEYERQILNAVKGLGMQDRVIFTGHRDDPLNVIDQLDTLVINSSSEALVMVAIEAMAVGTPVIATDVGGTNEIIRHRYNGWLVDFGSASQLEEALITLYENDLQRRLFAKRSKAIVAERLNVDRFISEFQSVLLSDQVPTQVTEAQQAVPMSV